jgi:hypothetical protein
LGISFHNLARLVKGVNRSANTFQLFEINYRPNGRLKMEGTEDQNSGNKANQIGEISHLIHDRTVTLTEPNRYFAKQWRLLLPSHVEGVTETEPNVFRLEPKTFERFLSVLRSQLEKGVEAAKKADNLYQDFRASDWIALALMIACPSKGYLDAIFLPRFVRDRWRVANFPPQGSVSDSETANGSLAEPSAEELNGNGIAIKVELRPDEENVPSVRISIKGEPLRVFEDLWQINQDSPAKHEVQKRAESVWQFLTETIAAQLMIERPDRGRPRGEAHFAAFLHDHTGLSWQQIAQQLCQQKHVHGLACRENYRKQAEQYWKRERKRLNAGRAQSSPTN